MVESPFSVSASQDAFKTRRILQACPSPRFCDLLAGPLGNNANNSLVGVLVLVVMRCSGALPELAASWRQNSMIFQ
jgi:hypothetical protein